MSKYKGLAYIATTRTRLSYSKGYNRERHSSIETGTSVVICTTDEPGMFEVYTLDGGLVYSQMSLRTNKTELKEWYNIVKSLKNTKLIELCFGVDISSD